MENKILKYCSLLILFIVVTLAYYKIINDPVLLYLTLFLTGILFNKKKDFLIFIIFLFYTFTLSLKITEIFSKKLIWYLLLFLLNYVTLSLLGLLFTKIFSRYTSFLRLVRIWIFTCIVSQFTISILNYILPNEITIISSMFFINFYFSGLYISKNTKLKNFIFFIIFPLLLIPIIFFTSKENYYVRPILFLVGLTVISFIGFFSYKIYEKLMKRNQ